MNKTRKRLHPKAKRTPKKMIKFRRACRPKKKRGRKEGQQEIALASYKY